MLRRSVADGLQNRDGDVIVTALSGDMADHWLRIASFQLVAWIADLPRKLNHKARVCWSSFVHPEFNDAARLRLYRRHFVICSWYEHYCLDRLVMAPSGRHQQAQQK